MSRVYPELPVPSTVGWTLLAPLIQMTYSQRELRLLPDLTSYSLGVPCLPDHTSELLRFVSRVLIARGIYSEDILPLGILLVSLVTLWVTRATVFA